MWTLGVETSAGEGGLALLKAGALFASRPLTARGASLVPAARDLCAEAGILPAQLERIAVDVGPGSFAGSRMGVTFAKTLAYASGCALAAVSSLEARAFQARQEGVLAVALDARRGRFYAGAFRFEGETLIRLFEDGLFDADTLKAALPGAATWLGDAAQGLLRPGDRIHPDALKAPEAATIARLGLAATPVTPFALAPAYLRLVEAQEKKEARERA